MQHDEPGSLSRRQWLAWSAAVASGMLMPAAHANVMLEDVVLEESVVAHGQKLVLNGVGVRYRAIFKVYGAGIYLKAKADVMRPIQQFSRLVQQRLDREREAAHQQVWLSAWAAANCA